MARRFLAWLLGVGVPRPGPMPAGAHRWLWSIADQRWIPTGSDGLCGVPRSPRCPQTPFECPPRSGCLKAPVTPQEPRTAM